MTESTEKKWTPQKVSQHVAAILCGLNILTVFQFPSDHDHWWVAPFCIFSLAWAVAGLMTAKHYAPLVVYAICVVIGIDLCRSEVLRWTGPGTRARQILDVLSKPEPSSGTVETEGVGRI